MGIMEIDSGALLNALDEERQKFDQADEHLMDEMIKELIRRCVYPEKPCPGNPNSTKMMVLGWGAYWHTWTGPVSCPVCKADLRDLEVGPPFIRAIRSSNVWVCPDCSCTWPTGGACTRTCGTCAYRKDNQCWVPGLGYTGSVVSPGGSACSCWEPKENVSPMPLRMGTDSDRRRGMEEAVRAAAKYAIRASTMNGAIIDFDPDAMVQNMAVGLLGYNTPTGLASDATENSGQRAGEVQKAPSSVKKALDEWLTWRTSQCDASEMSAPEQALADLIWDWWT